MDQMAMRRLRVGATIMLAVYSAGYLGWIAAHPDRYQWDFRIYYHASRAWMAGENPYDLEAIHRAGAEDVWLPFVYLPASLLLFAPFALLPYTVAWYAWLALTLGGLVLLVRLWRGLIPQVHPLLLWAVAVFGFGGALIWALTSGNVVVLTQLLLWTGFAMLLRDRPFAFALLTALVSVFKVHRLAFLALLLLVRGDRRRRLGALLAGLVGFVVLGLLPMVARPEMARSYWGHVSNLRESGKATPCALALIDDGWEVALKGRGVPAASREVAWGLYCLLVLGLSWRAIRRAVADGDRFHLLMVGIILYSLLVPRLKVYSYLMLIVPTLALYLPVMGRPRAGALYVALVALPGVLMQPEALTRVYHHYYPFLVNLLMWLGYLFVTAEDEAEVPASAEGLPPPPEP